MGLYLRQDHTVGLISRSVEKTQLFSYNCRMINKLAVAVLFVLFFGACSKDNPGPVDPEMTDEHWIKINLPDHWGRITAIYGNIEDTLLIARMDELFITTDQGASWQMVYDAGVGIAGFYKHQKELLALNGFINGEQEAIHPTYSSVDNGRTWQKWKYDVKVYDELRVERKIVRKGSDSYYAIVPQEPIPDEVHGGTLRQPDRLVKVVNGSELSFYFPFERTLQYLYMDANDRMYVGADGTRFEWQQVDANTRRYPSYGEPAIIYISRKPIKF